MTPLMFEAGASMAGARRDEALAFERLAGMLEGVRVPSTEATRAAHNVRRIWSALVVDLGGPDNSYPPALKAELIGIGIAMIRDAEALLDGEPAAATRMAEVSRMFAGGLSGHRDGAEEAS